MSTIAITTRRHASENVSKICAALDDLMRLGHEKEAFYHKQVEALQKKAADDFDSFSKMQVQPRLAELVECLLEEGLLARRPDMDDVLVRPDAVYLHVHDESCEMEDEDAVEDLIRRVAAQQQAEDAEVREEDLEELDAKVDELVVLSRVGQGIYKNPDVRTRVLEIGKWVRNRYGMHGLTEVARATQGEVTSVLHELWNIR